MVMCMRRDIDQLFMLSPNNGVGRQPLRFFQLVHKRGEGGSFACQQRRPGDTGNSAVHSAKRGVIIPMARVGRRAHQFGNINKKA